MELITHTFAAGESFRLSEQGTYFRLLSGTDLVQIKTDTGFTTSAMVGIGYDLSKPIFDASGAVVGKLPFNDLYLSSKVPQTVKILVTYFPTTDSRLTGDVDINGLLSVVNAGGSSYNNANVTLVAATAAPVINANLNRLKATLVPDVEMYIGVDATVTNADGIKISAGEVLQIDNTAALYGYSVAGGLVRVLEELK